MLIKEGVHLLSTGSGIFPNFRPRKSKNVISRRLHKPISLFIARRLLFCSLVKVVSITLDHYNRTKHYSARANLATGATDYKISAVITNWHLKINDVGLLDFGSNDFELHGKKIAFRSIAILSLANP